MDPDAPKAVDHSHHDDRRGGSRNAKHVDQSDPTQHIGPRTDPGKHPAFQVMSLVHFTVIIVRRHQLAESG